MVNETADTGAILFVLVANQRNKVFAVWSVVLCVSGLCLISECSCLRPYVLFATVDVIRSNQQF